MGGPPAPASRRPRRTYFLVCSVSFFAACLMTGLVDRLAWSAAPGSDFWRLGSRDGGLWPGEPPPPPAGVSHQGASAVDIRAQSRPLRGGYARFPPVRDGDALPRQFVALPPRQPAWSAPPPPTDAPEALGTRWVVLTTINGPTEAVRRLCQDPSWRVVVVGDVSTPADWRAEGCEFLSMEAQRQLPWHTVDLLPEHSYARKNLGYLYAVAHGATLLYETDDDNLLLDGRTVPVLADRSVELAVLSAPSVPAEPPPSDDLPPASSPPVFNVYAYFGQPSIWPRGFPLPRVGESPGGPPFAVVRGVPVRPLIQQGLANGDPDVDAVFRLTRKAHGVPLAVQFDGAAPPLALPAGVFCPFNTQNTVHLADAFFALLIPLSTTFRVCDIWRGYIAQRLLWEVGGQLAFVAPYVHQDRNEHDYTDDFVDEDQLYTDVPRLLEALRRFQCPADGSILYCAVALMSELAADQLLGVGDVALARAWFSDLLALGYRPPDRLVAVEGGTTPSSANGTVSFFSPARSGAPPSITDLEHSSSNLKS